MSLPAALAVSGVILLIPVALLVFVGGILADEAGEVTWWLTYLLIGAGCIAVAAIALGVSAFWVQHAQ